MQPRSLLVTIYGLYARSRGGALGVAGVIRLMAELGVDEQAVRSLISRLKSRGILQPVRVAGAAGYGLTDDGTRLLDEGDRRIYGRTPARLADGWLLAVFSVPEAERARRHSLRSALAGLGFGTVSAGVWIAPAQLAGETGQVLHHYQLDRYVELFDSAEIPGDAAAKVAQWWDLGALAQLYRSFVADQRSVLGPVSGRTDAVCFADYVPVITAWRRLPYRDPGLPVQVLPADWPGAVASDLFARLKADLETPAGRHAATVLDGR